MNRSIPSKFLAFVLALVMVFSMLPVSVFAEETVTFTKITTLEELTTGTYVLVTEKGYAPGVLDGTWITAAAVSTPDSSSPRWTITVDGDTATLTDANGTSVAPKGGNNNGIQSGDYSWDIACADGTFTFSGQGDDTVILASNTGSENKFRAYKNDTVSGKPNGYPSQFTLYKVTVSTVTPPETETVATPTASVEGEVESGTDVTFSCATEGATIQYRLGDGAWETGNSVTITEAVTITVKASKDGMDDSKEAKFSYTIKAAGPETVSIATALMGETGTEFTVKGVVTLVDGKNIHIQDATGGINLYLSSASTDVSLGDTIIGTGTRGAYKGLPQLSGAIYEKSSGLTLTAKETTIGALTNADICTYVSLKGVEVTEVSDNNGACNITVKDTEGKSILVYKAVVGKTDGTNWDVKVGDTIDICAALSIFNTLQLRNTLVSEITVVTPSTAVAAPTASPAAGEVPSGTEISFSCATEGAAIQYHTGDNVWKTYAAPIAITEATTFTAKAVKDGVESAAAEFAYTIKAEADKLADKMDSAPVDGDTVLIYNPANTAALGAEASGTKLAGVTASAEGDQLAVAEGMAQLVVSVESDGSYVFTLDGKYLTSGETGNSLSFADTLTDCGKWTLTQQTDGTWYLKNVGANYNGNYNQSLEYYKGFTTYGEKADNAAYKMELYLVSSGAGSTGPLADGEKVVIYNPANLKALSTTYTGFYNNGTDVTVADGVLSGFTAADVWTVGVNEDGSYTFSTADGKKFSMGASYSSTPLDDVNTAWSVEPAATEGCYYIKNVVRGNYLEWYASKSNWSSYGKLTDEALFAQAFYKVVGDIPGTETGGLPVEGAQAMLYNANAKGVLSLQDDNVESPSITGVSAEVADGKAVSANGGLLFTVEKNGEYYRFKNETYGYLCSNGTGNNAFYSLEASEDADWTVTECNGGVGGFDLESRTAKYKGYGQWLEYYSDSYKTYNMDPSKVTDYTIYSFFFYPCGNESSQISGGIVNAPAVDFGTPLEAYVGQDYTLTFTVDAVFGVEELTVKLGEQTLETTEESGVYTLVIPAEKVAGESLTVAVTGKDTKGVDISGTATVTVKDEPVIGNVTPAAGSETGDDKKPLISAEVSNAGENPEITVTINGEAVEAVYDEETGLVSYTPAEDLADGRTTVTVTVVCADKKEAAKTWSFTVGKARYQLYFGQLHSHTGEYSDGSGTLDAALDYVKNLPESANVDFVAFTDHSNYFDTTSAANPEGALYDMSLASESSQSKWNAYKSTVAQFNASQSDVVAIAGFEMTWSGGPGHINTFNTPGIVSRNNTTLNNKTSDAGMKAYYALLSQPEGANSLSQFNHPGSTFGTFSDFAYYDALIDSRIFLVEVGNGEGQVGAGGYYPSYEYYTMALDKGWHVAPTNNQDNHKGKWGNANDARDVVITDDFSEQGLYSAIRQMRVYATEDKNLEITYTLNDQLLGSVISKVPEALNIAVTVNDPDASDSISKVEVIVNSGKTIYTWNDPAVLTTGDLTVTLDPGYSYYYIRVTEGDGDIAVTAPVWVGESLKLGISSLECGTSTPVTGEALTLTTTLFNSESSDAAVKSVTYTTGGSTVLGTDTIGYTIPASGTLAIDFAYTPDVAKVMTVTAAVVVEQNGKEYTFTKDIELDVQDASKLAYIGIDASHHNEYVAGNYKDSMGNFGALAAEYSVRTVELKTSEDLIAACKNDKYKAVILTAPSRRDGSALRDPYDTYSDAEIDALVKFNQAGGAVILCGWGDYYESYASFPAEDHMAAQQNKILTALGSSLRISDDETKDNTHNGGQAQRLYLSSYNFDSFLLEGVEYDAENPHNNMYTELYSQYGGASIYTVDGTIPATVTPVVYGFDTTYSSNDDKDSYGGPGSVPKYSFDGADRLMVMATEKLEGQGLIVVAGAAFLSNFEVQATISDSGSEKNYSNYKICENLLQYLNPVTAAPIAEVRAQTEDGYKYTIEGIVTSNASGYDKDTAFFDCIYVQDATGGICCFPVAGNYKIGDKVRITGTTDFYQGEPELQVTSIEKIGEAEPVTPTAVTAAQISNRSAEGKLVTLSGTVESFALENGLVQTILVKDAAGNVARAFIDGYITTSNEVENLVNGADITVTGLASYDDTFNAPEGPFPRIRVRNRADVVCTLPEHDCAEDGHVWDEGTVTKAPTCTKKGVKTYTCRFCEETKTEAINALGHDWDDGVYTKEPTCTKKGKITYTCKRCQETKTETVPALGHNFEKGFCTRCKVDQRSAGTGDIIMIWVIVLAVSAAAIVLLVLFRRRKKNGKSGK